MLKNKIDATEFCQMPLSIALDMHPVMKDSYAVNFVRAINSDDVYIIGGGVRDIFAGAGPKQIEYDEDGNSINNDAYNPIDLDVYLRNYTCKEKVTDYCDALTYKVYDKDRPYYERSYYERDKSRIKYSENLRTKHEYSFHDDDYVNSYEEKGPDIDLHLPCSSEGEIYPLDFFVEDLLKNVDISVNAVAITKDYFYFHNTFFRDVNEKKIEFLTNRDPYTTACRIRELDHQAHYSRMIKWKYDLQTFKEISCLSEKSLIEKRPGKSMYDLS